MRDIRQNQGGRYLRVLAVVLVFLAAASGCQQTSPTEETIRASSPQVIPSAAIAWSREPMPTPVSTVASAPALIPKPITTAPLKPTSTATPTLSTTPSPTPTLTAMATAAATPKPTPTTRAPLPTVAPPVLDPEISLDDLSNYSRLLRQAPTRERMVRALPWINDGLQLSERRGAQGLVDLALHRGDQFFDLMEEPWVSGGRNQPAMRSLGRLARWYPDEFLKVTAHPAISDGISDEEAKIVATLWGLARYNPELIDTLLDPDQVELEERGIDLPHTGRVHLTIVRTSPGAAVSMDLTETAVRTVEGFMSLALPQREVITLYADAKKGGFGAQNFWTHIAYGTHNDSEHSSAGRVPHYAHEVGHYYFRGGDIARRWVTEGAANFLQSIQANSYSGVPVRPEKQPCAYARNLVELESLDPQVLNGAAVLCPYSLGERLFHDLYRNMDETTFRLGFRRLYLLSQIDNPRDGCNGTELNICHVRAAFTSDVSRESVATVEKVIGRWYDGSEAFDHSFSDAAPVEPIISERNVRIDRAYLSAIGGGTPVTGVTSSRGKNPLYLNLEYSYGNDSGSDYLPLQIALHFEGDGFTFASTYWNSEWPLRKDHSKWTHWVGLGPWPEGSLPGNYWVYAYWGDQKVAEVAYKVDP